MDTFPSSITPHGDIVGFYYDGTSTQHGFLLHQGSYTTIDDPKGSGPYRTAAYGINPQGDIVGDYVDSTIAEHGFLLHQGSYTTIDDPTAVHGTAAYGINLYGDIVGFYWDSTDEVHGFLLQRHVPCEWACGGSYMKWLLTLSPSSIVTLLGTGAVVGWVSLTNKLAPVLIRPYDQTTGQ